MCTHTSHLQGAWWETKEDQNQSFFTSLSLSSEDSPSGMPNSGRSRLSASSVNDPLLVISLMPHLEFGGSPACFVSLLTLREVGKGKSLEELLPLFIKILLT